ncbi:MAG: hypothetical protein ACK5CA_01580 [Cyanobacteriota bacterium]
MPTTAPAEPSVTDTIRQQIQEKAEPINRNLENRYRGVLEDSELQEKINIQQSQKLLQRFEESGSLDGGLPEAGQLKLPKIFSTVGAADSETFGTWEPYLPMAGGTAVLALLVGFHYWGLYRALYQKICGERGLYHRFLMAIGKAKPDVSVSDAFLHDQALEKLRWIANAAQDIDSKKFSQEEFLVYAKLRLCFEREAPGYEGLAPYKDCFHALFGAYGVYQTLHQIEHACQGSKQQEFYQFAHRQLAGEEATENLDAVLQEKLIELLPQVQTDAGRERLEDYGQCLTRLLETPNPPAPLPSTLGLFNRLQTRSDYGGALQNLSQKIARFREETTMATETFVLAAMEDYDDLECFGDLMGLPEAFRSPDAYGRLLQDLTLSRRYQDSFAQFQTLLDILRQWTGPYQNLRRIRQSYPAEQFRQPSSFVGEIPGFALARLYQQSLTYNNTNYHFIYFV